MIRYAKRSWPNNRHPFILALLILDRKPSNDVTRAVLLRRGCAFPVTSTQAHQNFLKLRGQSSSRTTVHAQIVCGDSLW